MSSFVYVCTRARGGTESGTRSLRGLRRNSVSTVPRNPFKLSNRHLDPVGRRIRRAFVRCDGGFVYTRVSLLYGKQKQKWFWTPNINAGNLFVGKGHFSKHLQNHSVQWASLTWTTLFFFFLRKVIIL